MEPVRHEIRITDCACGLHIGHLVIEPMEGDQYPFYDGTTLLIKSITKNPDDTYTAKAICGKWFTYLINDLVLF